jgi:hypothetical protein
MKHLVFVAFVLVFVGCGGGEKEICTELVSGSSPLFDPYAAESGMVRVRVGVDGLGQYDDATSELSPSEKSACVSGEFDEGGVNVRAEGFDEDGNLVAFGSASGVGTEGDETVTIKFRRNVAVVTHLANPRQDRPASKAYVIDVAKRTLIGTTRLPGAEPIGRGVSTRGGDSILVAFDDGPAGFIGELSADTGEWRGISLNQPQDLALAIPGQRVGIAVGGGSLTYVDFDAGSVLHEFPMIGGRVRDGAISLDGRRAIIIVDRTPGTLIADLTDNCTSAFERDRCLVALDVVPDPGGVAISSDGGIGYIVSAQSGGVVQLDLARLSTRQMGGVFPAGVFAAAFSDQIQSVLAIERRADGTGRVHTFVVPTEGAVSANDAIQTNLNPMDISADPSGRRAIVVSVGTSTETAGLTVIETAFDVAQDRLKIPVGSSRLYPEDPEDAFMIGDFTFHQRYQPARVAVLNGR